MIALQARRFTALAALVLALVQGGGVQAQDISRERLIVGVKEAPPFVMQDASGWWSGVSIELWEAVALNLDLDFEFRAFELEELRAGIEGGETDVLVGALSITPEREAFADFTHTYYVSSLGIAVSSGSGSVLGALSFLVSAAFLKLIAGLALVLILCGALVWWFERRVNPEQFEADRARGIGSGVWWAAVTMTTVGYGDKAPKSFGGRAMALVWMFSSLMLVSVFTGTVASVMTVSGLDARVNGPEDLPRVRVAAVEKTASGLWLDEERIAYVAYPTVEAALDALRAGDTDAVVYDRPILSYLVQASGDEDIAVLPRKFALTQYGFVLPPASPLREPINRAILRHTQDPAWADTVYRYTGAEM
jgi:ABC-type amino acid transport substrate-binding protein